jgi:hypothetical protein
MAPASTQDKPSADSARNTGTSSSDVVIPTVPPQIRMTRGGSLEGIPFLQPREIAMLRFVYEYLAKKLYYPTRSEIATAVLGAKTGGPTSPYVRRLLKFGYLALANARGHRNLRLTKAGLKRLAIEGTAIDPQLSLDLPTTV